VAALVAAPNAAAANRGRERFSGPIIQLFGHTGRKVGTTLKIRIARTDISCMATGKMRVVRNIAIALAVVSACVLFSAVPAQAATSAIGILGQSDYTTTSAQASDVGFSSPYSGAFDTTGHRLFVADQNRSRIAVHQLSGADMPADTTTDWVLGQTYTWASFAGSTTQSTMNSPEGVAYDGTTGLLYVADSGNNRVLVFDVASITNGENAVYVIGQSGYTTATSGGGASSLNHPSGLALDSSGHRLFVSDQSNSRVLVYDTGALANGMAASYVLGQPDFTTYSGSRSQSKLNWPSGVAYDPAGNRLFVGDGSNDRIMAWDVSSITNGMNASNVIGQSNFTTFGLNTTQSGLFNASGVAYDATFKKLYVVDTGNARVMRYDAASITNGQNADAVYGQSDYTSSGSHATQSGLNQPYGVAVDQVTHRIVIADSSANRALFYEGFSVDASATVNVDVLPSLSFTVAGYNSGTCNSATITDTTSTSTAMNLRPTSGTNAIAGQTLTVASNSANGYSLFTRYSGTLSFGSKTIADISSDNATPAVFSSAGTPGFGYTTDHALSGTSTRFQSNKWAKFTTSNDQIAYSATALSSSDVTHLCVQAGISSSTAAGVYTTTIVHTVVPSF
jgi:DNA-binding beta-propeller fold protein YncE